MWLEASKTVPPCWLVDLQVEKTHSRPHFSDDDTYSIPKRSSKHLSIDPTFRRASAHSKTPARSANNDHVGSARVDDREVVALESRKPGSSLRGQHNSSVDS